MGQEAKFLSSGLFVLLLCSSLATLADTPSYSSYEQVVDSKLPAAVLQDVISMGGKSKQYTDLIPLDGGTVGIAHFAVGGLASLYQEMDTELFFAKSRQEMITDYSVACRPKGKTGNDTGWGCYSRDWWYKGMKSFLASKGSEDIQNKAWTRLMKPTINAAIAHGWTGPRQIAIALGIANSLGSGGFQKLAAGKMWDSEETLRAYAAMSEHKARRRDALDKVYPK